MWVSPDAPALTNELRRIGFHARPATSDVKQGCLYVNWQINAGLARVSTRCVRLIREGKIYRWCPKAAARGEDLPIKGNDHGCDAFRYGLFSEASHTRVGLRARDYAVADTAARTG